MLYDTKATKNGAGTVKKSGPQLDPAHGKQYTKDVRKSRPAGVFFAAGGHEEFWKARWERVDADPGRLCKNNFSIGAVCLR